MISTLCEISADVFINFSRNEILARKHLVAKRKSKEGIDSLIKDGIPHLQDEKATQAENLEQNVDENLDFLDDENDQDDLFIKRYKERKAALEAER